MISVPLGQQRNGAKFEVWLARIANCFGADFVMKYMIEAASIADHRWRLIAKGEHGYGFVGRGWFAVEVYPALSLTGVLIAQQRKDAAAFHYLLNISAAAFLGEYVLAGAASKVVDKSV